MRRIAAIRRMFCAELAVLAAGAIGVPAWAAQCKLAILADLPVTMEGARASVPVKINGQETPLWLDSGAFFSFMPPAKAAEFGLRLEPAPFGLSMHGVGGETATLDVATIKSFGIVGHELKDVQFLVGGSDVGNGVIGRNILGMRETEFDLANGSVKLIDPHGCEHTVMTYWAPNQPFFMVPLLASTNSLDHTFGLSVMVNGARLEGEFATGAPRSMLSRSAALRAGIDLSAKDVVPTTVGGVGRHLVKGWVTPVAKVAIGDEEILHTHLEVADDSHGNEIPDLLLGADFLLAHHVYVARSQGRIYFTYSGGQPFRSGHDTAISTNSTGTPQLPELPAGTKLVQAVTSSAGDPKTAEGFARRGAARLTARDFSGALADLSEAIRQSPDTASYYADRARVYGITGNVAAARSDVDRSLALDPDNRELLRARAGLRLRAKDRSGALADAEAAVRLTPPGSFESAGLAILFIRLRQPARAIPLLDSVIAAHRDDARLNKLLNARCWARGLADSDLDKALADCNRAIKGGPDADVLENRGLVYFRQANYPSAIADLDAAVKLRPHSAWSLYLRGRAKIALGAADTGQADLTAAKAIRPDITDEVAGYGIGPAAAKAP